MISLLRSISRQVLYNTLFTFMMGTIIGGTFEFYIGDWIDAFGVWAPILAIIVVVVGGIAFVGVIRLSQRYLLRRTINLGTPPPQDRYRGLILLLGGGSRSTAPVAILHHQTKVARIWLIHTDFTKEIGEELQRRWQTTERNVHLLDVEHHYDPRQTALAITRAVDHGNQYKLFPQEIICDITGGTTAMTVGAIKGCQVHQLDMQMVTAYHDADLRAEGPLGVISLSF